MAAGPLRADECILLQTLPASARFHRPAVKKAALIHYIRLGISLAARSNPIFTTPEPQQQFPPYFRALFKRCCREGSVHKQTMPVLDTRYNAMYAVNGPPVSPMCMSMTTPSLQVCPWAAWAVVANLEPLLPRDTEYWPPPPFVQIPRFLLRRYWKNVVFINPLGTPGGLGLEPDQDARRQLVPNLRRLLTRPSNGIRGPDPAYDLPSAPT